MAHANTDVIDHIQDLNAGFFRQLLGAGDSTPWLEAATALGPTCSFMGAAAKPSDNEVTVRGRVSDLAADPVSAYCIAILGPNEPNDSSYPWGGATNTVKQQYWTWDQAQLETWTHRGGSNPGENRPPIYTGALRRNFSGGLDPNGHRYDEDIAAYASATWLGQTIAAYCDGIDHHQYDGENGPGSRVNGRDSFNHLPPSLVLGTDGKCSRVDYEIALAQQIAPTRPVKARSEFGWEDHSDSAQHALFAQETFLRCYQRGVMPAIYETLDEGPANPNGSGNWFGLYNNSDNPRNKPIYNKVKTLWNYTGSQAINGVAWVEPLLGVNPDCGVHVFSKAAGGWDVYILREAATSIDFVVSAGHSVAGQVVDHRDDWNNKHHTVALTSTMTLLQVS